MNEFHYESGRLLVENVPLEEIANQVGTPVYVYSAKALRENCRALKAAFIDEDYPTLPCYAVKANANLCVLNEIFSHGFGADVVSMGEMERALVAGVEPSHIVFSGVGKQPYEIARALEVGILSFNVESLDEIEVINQIASEQKRTARISLRINPNIDAKTHPHISTGLYSTKFGIAETALAQAVQAVRNAKSLTLIGIDCHIGSQITELSPFIEAARRMVQIAKGLMQDGFPLEVLNLGGGLGICYETETPPSLRDYARALVNEIRPLGLKLVLEPGRVIVGNCGALVATVIGTKSTIEKNFLIIDAAMNDLIRPSLYNAFHRIQPVKSPQAGSQNLTVDVVGPICETGDFLGRDRQLPPMVRGDLVMISSAGAYGSAMASHYNCRPQAAEVLVDGGEFKIVRPREKLESLWALELDALAAQT